MKKTIILGGGYAGIAAVKTLSRFPNTTETVLIDRKDRGELLPLLPDVLGERYSDRSISVSLKDFCEKHSAKFIHTGVDKLDSRKKILFAGNRKYTYDFLLLTCGAVPVYYGIRDADRFSFAFRSIEDVLAIRTAVLNEPEKPCFIIGGGYTGVEAAGNLRQFSMRHNLSLPITILEKGGEILPQQSSRIRKYITKQLNNMDVELKTNTQKGDDFFKEGGAARERVHVIWTAGVQGAGIPDTAHLLDYTRGRLRVNQYLQAAPQCYAAGDASLINYNGKDLPMFSFYARQQGRHAALNIVRESGGGDVLPYKPSFPGFVIPLPGGKGTGKLLGFPVRGPAAKSVHHFANILFSFTNDQRRRLLGEFLSGGPRY